MINKKHVFTAIISSIIAFSLTACNSGGNGLQGTTQSSSVAQQAVTVSGASSLATTNTASVVTDSKANLFVIDLTNTSYSVKTFDGTAWINLGTPVDENIVSVTGGKNSAGLGIDKQDNLYIAYASGSTTYIKKFNNQTNAWDLVSSFSGVFYNYTFNFDVNNHGYLSYNSSSKVIVNSINQDFSLTQIGSFGLGSGDVRNNSYTKINPSNDQLTVMHTEIDTFSGAPSSYISQYNATTNSWSNVTSVASSKSINYAINKNGVFVVMDEDTKDSVLKVTVAGKAYASYLTSSPSGAAVIADGNGDFYIFYANIAKKISIDATGKATGTTLPSVSTTTDSVRILSSDINNNVYASYLSSGSQIVTPIVTN